MSDVKSEDDSLPIVPKAEEEAESSLATPVTGDAPMEPPVDEEAVPAPEPEKTELEKLLEVATETLYIKNLNEKLPLSTLKQSLTYLFKLYGPVLSVTAHRSVRMRGQAFVAFETKEEAAKAMKDIKGFPLYGKPMVIAFSKTKADAVVRKLDNETAFENHKKARLEHKKISRITNPLRQKQRGKLQTAALPAGAAGTAATTTAKRAQVQMPDEYLPPNPTLFIQNISEDVSKEMLDELFSRYPNLITVRMIPSKRDIAFVDFADEASSTAAKDGLHNYKFSDDLGGMRMKVTFARR